MIRPILFALTLISAAQPAFAQADGRTFEWSRHRGDGVHLRILRDYHLAADATASQPIVVVGGSANIDGRAEAEIVVIGGTLRVGPQAVVRGDLVVVGGEAIIDPAANVAGEIAETIITWPDVGFAWARLAGGWWAVAAFATMLVRLAVVFVGALFLSLVAPRWIHAIGGRAGSAAGLSAVLGVAGELLFVPGVVILVVTLAISIIGIPLLAGVPFLIGGALVVWLAGFTAVAARLGGRLRGTHPGDTSSPLADLLVGFVAITTPTFIAHALALGPGWMGPVAAALGAIGLFIEYVAWTIGLGAALAGLFGRTSSPPPPVPVLPAPAPTVI